MIIKDKNLEPYYVFYDGNSYHLNEEKVTKTTKEVYSTTHGYYATLPNALLKVVEFKTNKGKNYNSLSEYIEQLNKNKENILNILN